MARQAARLSLNQKLALNASLATSIRVLRFDASGLTRYLEEQAATNPHLQLGPPPMDRYTFLIVTGEAIHGGGRDPKFSRTNT